MTVRVTKVPSRLSPLITSAGGSIQSPLVGRFIEDSEADRARFGESKNLFSEYLPYAVVFGSTKKWAKAFEGRDGELPATPWFTGSYSGHTFNATSFSEPMGGFTVTTAGTIASTPSSSGGRGFSGGSSGGGGGGGGGSW
ncbi:MAG: hypothetical protein WD627_02405 [Actinomycetota bacterium]